MTTPTVYLFNETTLQMMKDEIITTIHSNSSYEAPPLSGGATVSVLQRQSDGMVFTGTKRCLWSCSLGDAKLFREGTIGETLGAQLVPVEIAQETLKAKLLSDMEEMQSQLRQIEQGKRRNGIRTISSR